MNIATTVVLIVVLALMLIMPYFTQKKRNKEYMDMLSGIKVGDLVKTAGGIIGKVNKITDKGEIRTVVIETGSKSQKSYLEMDMTMIYCVLNKTTKTEGAEKVAEEKVEANEPIAEEVKAEEVKTENEEPKAEDTKPAKKPATKKITSKTTKKTTSKTKKAE